jgi:hypothetical protein
MHGGQMNPVGAENGAENLLPLQMLFYKKINIRIMITQTIT